MKTKNAVPVITEGMTLDEVAALPGFDRFGRLLFACRPATWERFGKCPVGMMDASGGRGVMQGLQRAQKLMEQGFAFDLPLWPADEIVHSPDKADTRLFHFPGRPGAPFVLVVPGGGYQSVCTMQEGFPAAERLSAAGYHAFVLCYRVRQPKLMPKPIEDAVQALRVILENADALGVACRYAVMGFSAGGHLAAELCTDNFGTHLYGLPRPDAAALCYAALDLRALNGNETAGKMLETVAGSGPLEDYCIDLHTDAAFPPTILWQCEDDDVVSFENLRLMEKCLAEQGIAHRSIAYPRGGHGLCKPHGAGADRWCDEVLYFFARHLPLQA